MKHLKNKKSSLSKYSDNTKGVIVFDGQRFAISSEPDVNKNVSARQTLKILRDTFTVQEHPKIKRYGSKNRQK